MTSSKESVLKFIAYMRSMIEHRPQCFLVSCMIKQKFQDAVSYYDNNHVITKVGNFYFDWDGIVESTKNFRPFSDYGDNWIINHYNAATNTEHDLKPIIKRNYLSDDFSLMDGLK